MSAASGSDDAGSGPCPTVPLREAVEPEARISEEDGQHLIEATLIRAGRSRMGNSYSVQVLREAVPLFEGARAFVDHPRPGDLPERSVRDLVGHYSDVYLDDDGERLRGTLHLIPGNDWLFQLMRQAEGNPNLCGLSIDALGERNARTGEVRKLVRVNSVDIVTRPSAGGQFDHILQSDRGGHSMPDVPTTASAPPTAQPTPSDGAAAPTRALESNAGASAPLETAQRDDLQALMESVRRERDLLRCEVVLNRALSEAALPEPVTRKLRRRFGGQVFATEALSEAVQEERDTLAALSEAGAITGMGYVKPVQMGMDPLGQLQAAFDGLFDIYESDSVRQVPRLSGIREAFQLATGIDVGRTGGADRPLRPELQESVRRRALGTSLQESEVFLREADVTTSSFSYLLGTSMNKRLLQDYKAWPAEWQKFTNIVTLYPLVLLLRPQPRRFHLHLHQATLPELPCR